MVESSELLELVYKHLRGTKESETFENIWNYIASNSDLTVHGQSKEDIIAELYTDLVLDNRFVLTSDGKWGLREFIKFDDVKKQYDYSDSFETTEEFDDIDIDYDEDTNEDIDLDDFDLDDDDEDDEDDDFDNEDLDDELKLKEDEIDVEDDTVAEKLGITEEIDWNELEKEIEENN